MNSDLPRVAVTDYLEESTLEQEVLAGAAEVVLLGAQEETGVVERAGQARVLLVFHAIQLTDWSLGRLESCQGIVRCGVGYDNVDVAAAGRRGIVVCNVPDYGTEEVADHALLLLLAVARRLLPADQAIRAGCWDPGLARGAPRLRGKTLGLVGCGRIGSALARRAQALGLRVVYFDPYVCDGHEKALGVERAASLESLLRQSEFLSLHCPLTSETHALLNERTLALLPEGAYVINTARGGCIDLASLADVLDSGRLAGAGLDVTDPEPLADDRIRRHPRVVLTPHAAFYSVESFIEMRRKAALEARRIIQGQPPRNPVNLHCLYEPRCPVATPSRPPEPRSTGTPT